MERRATAVLGQLRQGAVGHGMAWLGTARSGVHRYALARYGGDGIGKAWPARAWTGKACPASAGYGAVRQGRNRCGLVGLGVAQRAKACHGMPWRAADRLAGAWLSQVGRGQTRIGVDNRKAAGETAALVAAR